MTIAKGTRWGWMIGIAGGIVAMFSAGNYAVKTVCWFLDTRYAEAKLEEIHHKEILANANKHADENRAQSAKDISSLGDRLERIERNQDAMMMYTRYTYKVLKGEPLFNEPPAKAPAK